MAAHQPSTYFGLPVVKYLAGPGMESLGEASSVHYTYEYVFS